MNFFERVCGILSVSPENICGGNSEWSGDECCVVDILHAVRFTLHS